VASAPADPVSDGADYRLAAVWLTDAEYADLRRDLTAAYLPRQANAPGPGRRRMIYNVVLPAAEPDGARG
jgi:hypothetical protein